MSDATRRRVLQAGIAGLTASALPVAAHAQAAPAAPEAPALPQVERRTLGRTGAEVGILGLGLGSQFIKPHLDDPAATEAILTEALNRGCNYFDTASSYEHSEEMVGGFVKRNRDRIFMVSKSRERGYDGMKREIELSLKRLQTEYIDLYHMHQLMPKDTDPEAMAKGCHKALLEARDQGLIRHIGVTGHSGPDVLMKAIKRLDPDVVLSTFPCTRPDEGRYETELLPLARERNMGVVAMKCVRRAREAALKGADLVRYSLSLDGVTTAIVGLDQQAHLEQNSAMASTFVPMTEDEQHAMHHQVTDALCGLPAIWDMPGYEDSVRLT